VVTVARVVRAATTVRRVVTASSRAVRATA